MSKELRVKIADEYGFNMGSGGTITDIDRREKTFYYIANQIPAQLRKRIAHMSIIRRKNDVFLQIIKKGEKIYSEEVSCPYTEYEDMVKVMIPDEFIVRLCMIL